MQRLDAIPRAPAFGRGGGDRPLPQPWRTLHPFSHQYFRTVAVHDLHSDPTAKRFEQTLASRIGNLPYSVAWPECRLRSQAYHRMMGRETV